MPRPAPVSLLVLAAACAAPEAGGVDAAGASVETRVQAALREMFPEVEGELTRASIQASLAPKGEEEGPRARSGRSAEAAAALAGHDLERAHALIVAELLEGWLAEGRALLAAHDAAGALIVLERAAEIAPRERDVLYLRAEAALALGLEHGERARLEQALEGFLAAARGAEQRRARRAWIGASRAAAELGRPAEAIDHARRALESEGGAIEAGVSTDAQRALARASADAYAQARAEGLDEAVLAERFEAARAALETLVDRAPDEPWGWIRLAQLLEQDGQPAAAQELLRAGLERSPADPALHEQLAAVARRLSGSEGVLALYAEIRRAHPDVALAWWHPARERLEAALDGLRAGRDTSAAFAAAETEFKDCRTLAPERAQTCLASEVLCRAGVGWCRLRADDLSGAHKAFLSMDRDLPDGLKLEIPGRLESGVRGLAAVAEASIRRAADPNSLERAADMERASKIFDFLHAYEPESLDWARNAGFLNRDTAVLLEQRARALARAGDAEQANRLLARAREMMERSLEAYADACALAPVDVRMHGDAGRVLVHYLQRDWPRAEEYLMRAVELGVAQVAAARAALDEPGLDEEELRARRDAVVALEVELGDAYETLGELQLTLRGQPGLARGWFQKALAEGGPDPRPAVASHWLARCDAAEAGRLDATVRDATRWAAPIER